MDKKYIKNGQRAIFVASYLFKFIGGLERPPYFYGKMTKYLREDERYDIIASGSLLGIRYKEEQKDFSVPVGSEKDIEMFPLDFEEFLWANGIDESKIEILKKYFVAREKAPSDVNEKCMRYFKTYMFVGGIYENAVFTQLMSKFENMYYYKNEKNTYTP